MGCLKKSSPHFHWPRPCELAGSYDSKTSLRSAWQISCNPIVTSSQKSLSWLIIGTSVNSVKSSLAKWNMILGGVNFNHGTSSHQSLTCHQKPYSSWLQPHKKMFKNGLCAVGYWLNAGTIANLTGLKCPCQRDHFGLAICIYIYNHKLSPLDDVSSSSYSISAQQAFSKDATQRCWKTQPKQPMAQGAHTTDKDVR